MRKFLKQNEIYFKTIAYTLLTVIGVWLAFQANSIASNQTQILKEQSEILKREQLPIINMSVKLEYDEQTEKYVNDILEIYNDGSTLRDLTIDKGIFLFVEYGKDYETSQRALLPFNDYYIGMKYFNQSTGLLAHLFTDQNNLLFNEFVNDFNQYMIDNDTVGILSRMRYVQIGYTDIFGEKHLDLFFIDSINGCSEIGSGIYRLAVIQAFGLFDELDMYIDLGNTSPEDIILKSELFQSVQKDKYPILHFMY